MNEDLVRRLKNRADRRAILHGDNNQDVRLLREAISAIETKDGDVLAWVRDEAEYCLSKYGTSMDDEHASEGFVKGAYWYDDIVGRVDRVRILGPENPLGVQALLKLAVTACNLAETFIRVNGSSIPDPGAASGELEYNWIKRRKKEEADG